MRTSSQGELDELVMPPRACSRALTRWMRGCMALSSSLNLASSPTKSNPDLALARSLTLSSKASSSSRRLSIASICWVLLIILASFPGFSTACLPYFWLGIYLRTYLYILLVIYFNCFLGPIFLSKVTYLLIFVYQYELRTG